MLKLFSAAMNLQKKARIINPGLLLLEKINFTVKQLFRQFQRYEFAPILR